MSCHPIWYCCCHFPALLPLLGPFLFCNFKLPFGQKRLRLLSNLPFFEKLEEAERNERTLPVANRLWSLNRVSEPLHKFERRNLPYSALRSPCRCVSVVLFPFNAGMPIGTCTITWRAFFRLDLYCWIAGFNLWVFLIVAISTPWYSIEVGGKI